MCMSCCYTSPDGGHDNTVVLRNIDPEARLRKSSSSYRQSCVFTCEAELKYNTIDHTVCSAVEIYKKCRNI
jgi:hypothetical protein